MLENQLCDLQDIPACYSITQTKSLVNNICIHVEGVPQYIYSIYDPNREIHQWIKMNEEKLSQAEHILVVGIGLGYHLQELIRLYPNKKYYLYEPDRYLFSLAMNHADLTVILSHPNIEAIAIGSDENTQQQLYRIISSSIVGSYAELVIPSYARLYKETIDNLAEAAKTIVYGIRSNTATLKHFSELWLNNIFDNLKHLVNTPNISFMKDVLKGIPAIIVGSGPSLKYDLEMLRKIRHKAIIIAAGTSVQALLKADIEPHLIVSVDGGEPNYRAFSNVDTCNIPLVFGTYIHPGILEKNHNYAANLIIDIDKLSPYYVDYGYETYSCKSTYSVTGICIQLAAFMGCENVLFTGQDLSYPNHEFYAEGVNHGNKVKMSQVISSASIEVENNCGGMNPTTKVMFSTKRDIEMTIQYYPHIQFVNTSKEGARIRGAEYRSLESYYGEYLSESYVEVEDYFIKDIFMRNSDNNQLAVHSLLFKLEEDTVQLHRISRLLDKVQSEIYLLEKYGTISDKRKLEMIMGIYKQWSKIEKHPVYSRVIYFGMRVYIDSFNRYARQIRGEGNVSEEMNFIETYLSPLISKILDFNKKVIIKIESALDEIKSQKSAG